MNGDDMKKILTVAAIAVVAAVPATSGADTESKSTAARGGGNLKVTFVLQSLDGKPVRIKDFKFKNFTVTCAVGGPIDVKGEIAKMRINDKGKFDGTVRKGDAKVHVEGEVRRKGKKVLGFLKAKGDFGGGAEDCLTKVNWEAS
jgi:hypothetical protein